MIVHGDDLIHLKYPEDWQYKVYSAGIRNHYSGSFKVAARDADEANQIIQGYRDRDPNNVNDSMGICSVSESDFDDYYSNEKGIVKDSIHYIG